jgi:hypothetical protein
LSHKCHGSLARKSRLTQLKVDQLFIRQVGKNFSEKCQKYKFGKKLFLETVLELFLALS